MFAAAGPCLALLATLGAQDEPSGLLEPVELRALFLEPGDVDVLGDPARLSAAMERLAEIGFDAVIPLVWSEGRALIASPSLAQLATGETALYPGRNAFAELVLHAHRHGLEVLPAIDGTFAGLPKLPQVKEGGRPLTSLPETRTFARAFATELARAADVDGLVLIDGLPALARHDANAGTTKAIADELAAWRAEMRALDPGLVVAWAALDPRCVGPAELGVLDSLDLVLLREPPPDAKDPLAAWLAAKPRRAGLWLELAPDLAPEKLLERLGHARTGAFAGEVLAPFAALAGEENAFVDALTQGLEAPYYARATLPWRGEVAWRPRAEPAPPEIVEGPWRDVEDPSGLEVKELPAGAAGSLSWSVKPEVRGRNELWVHLPFVPAATGKLVVSLTNDPRRVTRLEVDRSTLDASGWVSFGPRLLNRPDRMEVLRLEVVGGSGPAIRAGPLVALPRRRPEGR